MQEDVQRAALAAIEGVWSQLKHSDSTMRRIHETKDSDVSQGYRHYLDVKKEPGGKTFDYEVASSINHTFPRVGMSVSHRERVVLLLVPSKCTGWLSLLC